MRFAAVLAIVTIFLVNKGAAADLAVLLADSNRHPISDAVITIIPVAESKPALPSPGAAQTRTIDQKNVTFIPYVQIVRPGDSVVFRNSDDTRHHVYSFAQVKSFEFVLSPGESSPPLMIDRTGIVAVGCNIHDNMINYLFVSDAPWVAQSGVDGTVHFANLPAGHYIVHAWHPQLHPAVADQSQTISIDDSKATKSLEFTLSLLPDPRQRMSHERMRY